MFLFRTLQLRKLLLTQTTPRQLMVSQSMIWCFSSCPDLSSTTTSWSQSVCLTSMMQWSYSTWKFWNFRTFPAEFGEPDQTPFPTVTVVGWGTTYNDSDDESFTVRQAQQQKLETPVVSNTECLRLYKETTGLDLAGEIQWVFKYLTFWYLYFTSIANFTFRPEEHLCAGGVKGKDACGVRTTYLITKIHWSFYYRVIVGDLCCITRLSMTQWSWLEWCPEEQEDVGSEHRELTQD